MLAAVTVAIVVAPEVSVTVAPAPEGAGVMVPEMALNAVGFTVSVAVFVTPP